jgi:nickel transport system ATP-binding protein
MSLLQLDQVTRRYRSGGWFGRKETTTVLAGVSLSLQEGKTLGVIGRSGAGKSTLGRLILGLERPDGGEIRFRGLNLATMPRPAWRRFRREVQVVFQNALGSVNPRWPVGHAVSEPLRNCPELTASDIASRVVSLLSRVGLDPQIRDQYPHQMSGGQLQRVCIARALATDPRLIVLDEAVSSLDMASQAQILQLLRKVQDDCGVAYLFISHDIRVVAGFCDMVAVMDRGRITSQLNDLSCAGKSSDPVLQQLLSAILPAWPKKAAYRQ